MHIKYTRYCIKIMRYDIVWVVKVFRGGSGKQKPQRSSSESLALQWVIKGEKEKVIMTLFKVVSVIDGDTFTVPGWRSGQNSGTIVRPTGYDTPEQNQNGYTEAKDKLTKLILGKDVELGPAVNFDHGRIVCPVYINGVNLADYFPEYKV